jgi:hypothetical protein
MVQPPCRVRRPTLAANPAAVNTPGPGASASPADRAARLRGSFRSLPATRQPRPDGQRARIQPSPGTLSRAS